MSYVVVPLRLYLTVLLALIALVGDVLVSQSKIHTFQAIFDNVTHCMIGGLSWLLVCTYCKKLNYGVMIEVAVCAVIASLIDLDHFAMARSFSLQDATNLKGRPPLHCSTFPLFLCIFLLLMSYLFQNNLVLVSSLILLTAFISHHTRDATRRGYWFYPFGSTPPLPYAVYVIVTCTLPYIIFKIYELVKISNSNYCDSSII